MASKRYDIAFGIDDGYVPHLGALIMSILRNSPGANFRFIVMHVGVSDARKRLVESVAPQARFVWAQVSDDDVPQYAERGHFNRTTLFRLALDRLAPLDCRRVLYLDTDTILLRDIRSLFNSDLDASLVGAVVDSFVDSDAFRERWKLPASPLPYFNAGVLLIDLERVRAECGLRRATDFIVAHGVDLPFNDQDALNWAFWGQWRPLSPIWNAQHDMIVPWIAPSLPEEIQFHNRLPALVHFTGPGKPWTPGFYHPWAWVYWDNLIRTPFLSDVAKASGVGSYNRVRLWLRWLRRRPSMLAQPAQ
jgi:lipopolysaccharide biosynthesis glycosyltransferase